MMWTYTYCQFPNEMISLSLGGCLYSDTNLLGTETSRFQDEVIKFKNAS